MGNDYCTNSPTLFSNQARMEKHLVTGNPSTRYSPVSSTAFAPRSLCTKNYKETKNPVSIYPADDTWRWDRNLAYSSPHKGTRAQGRASPGIWTIALKGSREPPILRTATCDRRLLETWYTWHLQFRTCLISKERQHNLAFPLDRSRPHDSGEREHTPKLLPCDFPCLLVAHWVRQAWAL